MSKSAKILIISYKEIGVCMEINNIRIKHSEEYPEIINATADARTVMILKDLLSSSQGELEGVLQYFYQSRIANVIDKEISQILEEISIVEMEHAQLLMDAIVAFGGNPKFENSKSQPFSASYLNYSNRLKDILENNIKDEQQAVQNYINASNLVTNNSLSKLLLRIAEDERLHLNTFKTLQNVVEFFSV
jgi:bacterioferritin